MMLIESRLFKLVFSSFDQAVLHKDARVEPEEKALFTRLVADGGQKNEPAAACKAPCAALLPVWGRNQPVRLKAGSLRGAPGCLAQESAVSSFQRGVRMSACAPPRF